MGGSILTIILTVIVPLTMAIVVHEVAHGWMAMKLGDPTAKNLGRITLNPIKHIDPIGTILLPIILIVSQVGFIFAYAKPVPFNPANLRDSHRDLFWVAVAGPASNFIMALGTGFFLSFIAFFGMLDGVYFDTATFSIVGASGIGQILLMNAAFFIMINAVLGAFNLLPIPPLDGWKILAGLAPRRTIGFWMKLERYGMFIFIGIILFSSLLNLGLLQRVVMPMVQFALDSTIWITGLASYIQ